MADQGIDEAKFFEMVDKYDLADLLCIIETMKIVIDDEARLMEIKDEEAKLAHVMTKRFGRVVRNDAEHIFALASVAIALAGTVIHNVEELPGGIDAMRTMLALTMPRGGDE